nr:FGGY-family carbohydrate kinase [uncultured Dongia sp.]
MSDAGTLCLGIDIGTSGVRINAIDAAAQVIATSAVSMPAPRQQGAAIDQDPDIWWQAVMAVLAQLAKTCDLGKVARIAIDGTSGTLLLVDGQGAPRSLGLMYNDGRAGQAAARIKAVAPSESGAQGPSAALAKLLHLLPDASSDCRHAVHQADWIAGRLLGRFDFSDENNALKLGYDPIGRQWPAWLEQLGVPRHLLPDVAVPGTNLGTIEAEIAARLGLSSETQICAGTTDGVAAFIATGAQMPGDAVTSLGTTLVLKLLSDRPVFAAPQGIYSHRLGDRWLAGGASNSGGAALLAQFDAARIAELTSQLDPAHPTGLDYYPLSKPGERFPINDPDLAPRLTPRPASDVTFFQGMLEGIAEIERSAYARLTELGAPALRRVISIGGGASNDAWTQIRQRHLNVPVTRARQTEAAYGAALLALHEGPP